MKILQLYLKAFGPFTEHQIDLSEGDPGLHVIFGRNEAGKSSALRALGNLLFGVPARSTDNFVHEYSQMRVGGHLRLADGGELRFLRKKGNKNTLRSFDDTETLDDGELLPFLAGVSEGVFNRLFGIDHAALVEGGQSLLAHDGEVGKSLFAAGLGGANINEIQADLGDLAAELFKPGGSRPRINAGIARLKELRTRIKQDSLRSDDWKKQDRTLRMAEKELAAVHESGLELRAELSGLERLRAALTPLERRRQLRASIEELGAVAALSGDFGRRLEEMLGKRRDAVGALEEAKREQEKILSKLGELILDPSILKHREVVGDLRERLGSHKTALKDLPKRQGKRDLLGEELATELSRFRPGLPPDQLQQFSGPLSRQEKIQKLANDHAGLLAQIAAAGRRVKAEERTLERRRLELDRLPAKRDASELRRAIKVARGLGEIDARIQGLLASCEEAKNDCDRSLSALVLWSADVGELERVVIPQVETIERFQRLFEEQRTARDRSREDEESARNELREVDLRAAALQKAGAIPTETDLEDRRGRRDTGWRLVRRRWVDGEDVVEEIAEFAGEGSLLDVYEQSVGEADDVADRLRREADRVAAHSDLQARRERLERDVVKAAGETERLKEKTERLERSWQEEWRVSGIQPLPPREMLAWRRRRDQIVETWASSRKLRQELEALREARNRRRTELTNLLSALGEEADGAEAELTPLLVQAEEILDAVEADAKRREKLKSDLFETEERLDAAREEKADAEEQVESWRLEWNEAVDGLDLPGEADPLDALSALNTLKGILDIQRECASLDQRIHGMAKDIEEFESDVAAFVKAHAPSDQGVPADQAVQRLARRLSEAERAAALGEALEGRLEEQKGRAEAAEQALQWADGESRRLCEEARCSDDSGLPLALERWERLVAIREKLAEANEQLTDIGDGLSVEELEREAGDVDRDSLPARITELERGIEEVDGRRRALEEERAAARSALQQMTGGSAAALAAEEVQETVTRLRADAESFVRVRLALSILNLEVEKYRKQNQAPLVERASRLLCRLTLGSFTGLQSHYDDKDRPELVGVRGNQRKVRVSEMSSGTRDQLFLALRLATLEEYLRKSEPMPFICDDVLVNFDDERARATLEVLADMGRKTQVLLFTHHQRIREQAERLGAGVTVSTLEFDAE